jgi:hypothetical protein
VKFPKDNNIPYTHNNAYHQGLPTDIEFTVDDSYSGMMTLRGPGYGMDLMSDGGPIRIEKVYWDQFNGKVDAELYQTVSCARCDAVIELYGQTVGKDGGFAKEDLMKQMWFNGAVDKIHAGCGSKYDGDVLIFGICDDCIELLRNRNQIHYITNEII